MPVPDDRIERALRDAAPTIDTTDVVTRVAAKRARRRSVRRAEAIGLAAVLVALVAGGAVLLTGRGDHRTSVATSGTGFAARVVVGDRPVVAGAGTVRVPVPLTLDADEGYLRGPMSVAATGRTLSLAAYDRDGSTFTFPPSRIVRLDGTQVQDHVDLKAEILSITEGEGARWAVTRNPPRADGGIPDTFLKRIGPDGSVSSMQLPTGSDPVGPVAAVGGAVWVPVRDGVLQVDTTNQFVGHLALAPAATRSVALDGKAAYATDGDALRLLDPTGQQRSVTVPLSSEILGFASLDLEGRVLLAGEQGGTTAAHVVPTARAAGSASGSDVVLPSDFAATGLVASGGRMWATGTVGGSQAVVLLDNSGVRATVVLQNGHDATLAWTAADTVTAVSGGRLSRIAVG